MTPIRYVFFLAPLAALAAASAPAPAAAEVIAESVAVEATGEARPGSEARARALDRAFVSAVDQVLGYLVTEKVRDERQRDIERQIHRRARRYVESFRVVEEREVEGRVVVTARIRVAQRLVVERLDELGIERYRAGAADAAGEHRGDGRPKVAVFLAATAGEQTAATFGTRGGEGGPAGRQLVAELEDRGFEVVDAAGETVPVSREDPHGLLLSDEVAADLASRLGAGGAFVVGLESRETEPIRATRLRGAESRAELRVIDASGSSLVTRADTRGAGYGESVEEALGRAAKDVAGRALRQVSGEIAEYWPAPAQAADALTVTIRGAPSWGPVQAIAEGIARSPGVANVAPLGFDRGHVVLAVSTDLDVGRIAALARSAALDAGRIRTQARGPRELVIEVEGEPTASRFDR